MNHFAIALAASLLTVPAYSQPDREEPRYLDNRSTATDVVRSLYNAINRHEYLRAWSYFHEPERPDFENFAEGYAETEFARLEVSNEGSEGAAGTVYWTVPVAIEAVRSDGTTKLFAGCYTLSQANPAIQATPPFQPIGIRKGEIRETSGSLQDAIPTDCGDRNE